MDELELPLPPEGLLEQQSAPVDAPWLADPDGWSIRQLPAGELRPGVFCFMPSQQQFIPVAACTLLRGEKPLVFVDLANGRTLSLPVSEPVFVRVHLTL